MEELPKVSGFGKALRDAREEAQIDLRELAGVTKVQTRYIEALEAEDFSQVPDGVIGRGFVRLLARQLNADSDELIALYQEAKGEEALKSHIPPPDRQWDMSNGKGNGFSAIFAVAVILLVLAGFGVWMWQPWVTTEAVSSNTTATAKSTAANTAAANSTDTLTHKLEVTAITATWVEPTGNGFSGKKEELKSAQVLVLDVKEALSLRLADPAAVRLSWDNTFLKEAGEAGKESVVNLPEDLKSLIP
jgi:cytoskeletal protein RodZ